MFRGRPKNKVNRQRKNYRRQTSAYKAGGRVGRKFQQGGHTHQYHGKRPHTHVIGNPSEGIFTGASSYNDNNLGPTLDTVNGNGGTHHHSSGYQPQDFNPDLPSEPRPSEPPRQRGGRVRRQAGGRGGQLALHKANEL